MTTKSVFVLWIVLVGALLLAMAPSPGHESFENGVPAGTIIGWLPPEDGASIPAGWMVCSRANQIRHRWVPDLTTSGSFLRAAQEPFPATDGFDGGETGGTERHDHPMARRSIDERRIERRSSGDRVASEKHRHVLEPEGHLPPYVKVVFLCKCSSTDCSSG